MYAMYDYVTLLISCVFFSTICVVARGGCRQTTTAHARCGDNSCDVGPPACFVALHAIVTDVARSIADDYDVYTRVHDS